MKKVKGIRQHDRSDCAVACIAAVAGWYGLQMPLAAIRALCGASEAGTTIKGILDCCQAVGMKATPAKSAERNTDVLGRIGRPCILHTETSDGYLHFIVLCRTDGTRAEIMDPENGRRRKIRLDALREMWTGYLIMLEPGAGFKAEDRTASLMEKFGPIIRMFGGEIATATLYALVYIAIGISFSLFLQYFIDNVITGGDASKILSPVIVMVILAFISFFIGYIRSLKLLNAATGIDTQLIVDFIRHLFHLPAAFFNQRGAGEINSRISDAYKIRQFVTEGISSSVISLLTLVVSFALMFSFHRRLALFILLFIPVYTAIYWLAAHKGLRYSREIMAAGTLFEEKCVENIAAVKSIKYGGMENQATEALKERYAALCSKLVGAGRCDTAFTLMSETVSKAIVIILLAAGSTAIFRSELSVGELVSFYSITSFFSSPLNSLVAVISMAASTRTSARRLFDVLDLEEENREGCHLPCGTDGIPFRENLAFEHVRFAYPGAMEILDDFSATIPAGKVTAVTGPSGCGKSSLAQLALRMYSPSAGSVTLGGTDISLFALDEWRRHITIVPQDIRLFDNTILYNITSADPEPDIRFAAGLIEKLDLGDFIRSMPQGILTRVGEGGCRLSGGQKQRIALAAALYRRPSILILDEATNSLDSVSRAAVMKTLEQMKAEGMVTIVIISHRADDLLLADNIIEMKNTGSAFRKG